VIELKFFGRLGDIAGDSLQFESDKISTLEDVIAILAQQHPAVHKAISEPQVMVAVNQQVVDKSAPVSPGDEIAFLPPVTGG
jgi:sulfur-carrier protein